MKNEKNDKELRITAEIKRLNTILAEIPENKKKAAKSLIENAAFMAITLADLCDHINKNGLTDTYQNGEHQHGVKKSPQAEMYNTMIKNHAGLIKQLTDMLPDKSGSEKDDGFETYTAKFT